MRGTRFRGRTLANRRERPFRRDRFEREYVQVYRPRFRGRREFDRFPSRRGSSYRGERESRPFSYRRRGFSDRPRFRGKML